MSKMRRVKRDPERFEVMDLFEKLARKNGLNLDDPSTPNLFIDVVNKSFTQNKNNPIVLHGLRVQSMFEHVVAGLGKSALIKEEDSGEIIIPDSVDLQPPDFLIVLNDNKRFFVEVKNWNKVPEFSITERYLSGLREYSRIFGNELYVAIFWVKATLWTLVRPEDFVSAGKNLSIAITDAIKKNFMSMFGDVFVATKPPLILRVIADPTKPRHVNEDGNGVFTIGKVELYCNGELIEDPIERQLAFYFITNSGWDIEDSSKFEGRQLVHIEFIASPMEPVNDQELQSLGFLSQMISRNYNLVTSADTGTITHLSPKADPGSLSVLIPNDHKVKKLPLLLLTVQSS